jgi:hypothetical protein
MKNSNVILQVIQSEIYFVSEINVFSETHNGGRGVVVLASAPANDHEKNFSDIA